jgi:hypothetical protein
VIRTRRLDRQSGISALCNYDNRTQKGGFMAKEIQKAPSLELAVGKGGLGNLMRAIGEDSPEILTGVLGAAATAAYGPVAGLAATVGVKVLHGALKGQGWRQIAAALQPLKDAGKIKEDFEDSDLGKACLAELLDAIDRNPDPRRIQALKNAFLRIAMQPGTESEAVLQQQLLHIIGTLSSGEIVLLATMYRVGGVKKYSGAHEWLTGMANETGFVDAGLVALAETPLMEKQLVTPRQHGDRSGVIWGQRNRLTSLGERVCAFMQEP